MNGWLIYDAEGAKKNEWYIARLIEEAKKGGAKLALKIFNGEKAFSVFEPPDFSIVRTINPSLNKRLETLGIRTFNNAKTSLIANDKWQTYLRCKEWNIPVLDSCLFEKRGEQVRAYPLVMKAVDGHGGAQVYLVNNEEEAERLAETDGKYILQQPNEILGKDMRVYAIGGEIVAAVLRESETDFRSNFSLGGRVTLSKADETQEKIVKILYEKLRFDYVGIDFLPTKNGWVLNEIEDSAGARMLYQCSEVDIAELFIKHVLKSTKNLPR